MEDGLHRSLIPNGSPSTIHKGYEDVKQEEE